MSRHRRCVFRFIFVCTLFSHKYENTEFFYCREEVEAELLESVNLVYIVSGEFSLSDMPVCRESWYLDWRCVLMSATAMISQKACFMEGISHYNPSKILLVYGWFANTLCDCG